MVAALSKEPIFSDIHCCAEYMPHRMEGSGSHEACDWTLEVDEHALVNINVK